MAGVDMMAVVRRSLEKWVPHIEKMTFSKIRVETEPNGFLLIASWAESKAGPAGEYRVIFDRRAVLGSTASEPPLRQRPVKKTCQFRDSAVREILSARRV